MDLISMMSQLPSVDSASRSPSKMGPVGAEVELGFVDVLDLVKDIEVSQNSEQTQSELENGLEEQGWIPQKTEQTDPVGVDSLWIQQKLGQSGLGSTESLVGQVTSSLMPVLTENVESPSGSLKISDGPGARLSGDWFENARMDSLASTVGGKEPKVSRDAAAQWSLALARDEIQSVEVSNPRPLPLDTQKLQARSKLGDNAMVPLGSNKPVATEAMAFRFSALSPEKAVPQPVDGLLSFQNDKSKSGLKVETQKEKSVTSVSGSNFVLSHLESLSGSSSSSVESAKDAKGADNSALDVRVSQMDSAQLRFVSDRIEALALQGGGELRVVLNPEHLGSVELRVSKVQDRLGQEQQLRVEIRSDRPEVLQALENGKADLLASVGRNQSLRVDLQVLGSQIGERMVAQVTNKTENFVAPVALQAKPANLSSDSWFDLRQSDSARELRLEESSSQRSALTKSLEGVVSALETGIDSQQGDLLRDPARDFLEKSEDSKAQTSQWDRDRRREQSRDQARDQWAQSSGFRDSA